MLKNNLITRIKENFEDMCNVLIENCAYDYISLFQVYTEEILNIIEDEFNEKER